MKDFLLAGLCVLAIALATIFAIDYGCSTTYRRGTATIERVQHIQQYTTTTFIKSGDMLIPITDVHPEHWVGTGLFDGHEVSVCSSTEIKTGERIAVEESIGWLCNYGYSGRR